MLGGFCTLRASSRPARDFRFHSPHRSECAVCMAGMGWCGRVAFVCVCRLIIKRIVAAAYGNHVPLAVLQQ